MRYDETPNTSLEPTPVMPVCFSLRVSDGRESPAAWLTLLVVSLTGEQSFAGDANSFTYNNRLSFSRKVCFAR